MTFNLSKIHDASNNSKKNIFNELHDLIFFTNNQDKHRPSLLFVAHLVLFSLFLKFSTNSLAQTPALLSALFIFNFFQASSLPTTRLNFSSLGLATKHPHFNSTEVSYYLSSLKMSSSDSEVSRQSSESRSPSPEPESAKKKFIIDEALEVPNAKKQRCCTTCKIHGLDL